MLGILNLFMTNVPIIKKPVANQGTGFYMIDLRHERVKPLSNTVFCENSQRFFCRELFSQNPSSQMFHRGLNTLNSLTSIFLMNILVRGLSEKNTSVHLYENSVLYSTLIEVEVYWEALVTSSQFLSFCLVHW